MTNTFNALSLCTINAAGTSSKSLYSALSLPMFFGQKSPLEIRVAQGVVKPYFSVPIPEIESLNVVTKKTLLLEQCVQKTSEYLSLITSDFSSGAIESLIVVTSSFSNSETSEREQLEWQETVANTVNDYLPKLSEKIVFCYANLPSLDQTCVQYLQPNQAEQPQLVICIDSLVDYSRVKQLNQSITVQCADGAMGVMPSEGATSTLLLPNSYPDINQHDLLRVTCASAEQHLSVKEQLTQSDFSINNTVIHVGTVSETWAKHWYGQVNAFYHQKAPTPLEGATSSNSNLSDSVSRNSSSNKTAQLHVIDQTQVLGYLGVANLTTAIASAKALLTCPITQTSHIWLVEHLVNKDATPNVSAKVYQISLAQKEQAQLSE